MKNEILKSLRKFGTLPFLFIGSGISIRYLGLENWEGLLRKFAYITKNNDYAYEMYLQQAKTQECREGILPKVAELIEKDFNQKWFEVEEFKSSREVYRAEIQKGTSPFKVEIAKYMAEKSADIKKKYEKEIDLFKKTGKKSIAGIITTNYDCLLEVIFNDYEKYIGQEELIFSTIQGIAEIYKIHGCCSKPETIIINENDYVGFTERNAYLAAKILTIFLEHPVIFLGYSISDKNIENVLKAIVKCLSPANLAKLKERLIFIEWNNNGEADSISTYSKSFDDGKAIDMTRIKIQDYSLLYQALLENKAKYNAPVLRRLKQDIYDLVLTNKPTCRMRVVGLEDDRLEEVDIVIGVGVVSEFGKKGYSSLTAEEIYEDVVFDKENYDAELIVLETLPILLKHHSNSIPIYKYVSQVDCELPEKVRNEVKNNYDDLLSRTIKRQRERFVFKGRSITDLRKTYSDLKCLQYIPLLDRIQINISELHEFLKHIMCQYPDLLSKGNASDRTNLRRLIKIFDWLKYYNKAKELQK